MAILIGLTLLGAALLVGIVLPIVGFLRASRAAHEAAALRIRLSALEEQVRMLSASVAAGAHARTTAHAPAEARPVAAQLAPDTAAALARDAAAEESPGPPSPTDAAVQAPSAPSASPRADAAFEPLPPALPHAMSPSDERGRAESPGAATSAAERPAVPPQREDEGLESVIGSRLLLYVGTLVLVLGVAFFLKYAFDQEWLTEPMRVGFGAVMGLALITGGLRLVSRGYRVYGQILAGGGLAVLFLAVYAAFGFYGLIGGNTAFALLVAVTVAAAVLSDRQRSQGMAVMAVGGGFLTPFLVGGTTDAQVTLFSYVAALVGGTMYLAHRREWPLLNVLSYVLTVVTVEAWAATYYSAAKYLRTELFLTLYVGLFLVILRRALAQRTAESRTSAAVLASAPVLYHLASLAVLQPHGVALLVYFIASTLVAVGWAMRREGRAWLRLVAWAAIVLPIYAWLDAHQTRAWMWPGVAALGAIFGLHLVAQFDRVFKQESQLDAYDLLLVHLNGLGLFLGLYILLEPLAVGWLPWVGFGLALLHGGAALGLRPRDQTAALHALAVACALAAASVAVWLEGAWLTAAWAVQGAAVTWIGLRARRDWFRAAGALLLAAATGRWLALSLPRTAANFTLVLNEAFALGALVIALLYLLAWLHRRAKADGEPAYTQSIAGLLVAASLLTVVLLSAQNASYWYIRGATTADASFAEGLILSLLWAFYAGLLIVIGIRRQYAPIRYVAMGLFGLTVVKVFLVDLSGLEGIYRVLGLMAVGGVLLLVSFLYQRARTSSESDAA